MLKFNKLDAETVEIIEDDGTVWHISFEVFTDFTECEGIEMHIYEGLHITLWQQTPKMEQVDFNNE